MTKAELVTAIADKAGLNKAQAKEALDAFIASVSTSLKAGKEVRLVGFGSFVPIKRPGRDRAQSAHRRDCEARGLVDLPLQGGRRSEKHAQRLSLSSRDVWHRLSYAVLFRCPRS